MVEPLKPSRGGFLRPFGCGWFIREYLLGHGPYGSPMIDPDAGAPQADIFYHYKMSIRNEAALDRATKKEEKHAQRQKRQIEPDNIDVLTKRYLARMPYKGWGCRYHSFVVYFSNLHRLGWVESTGRETASSFQDHYLLGQPRKYYRLTKAGKEASEVAWANPRVSLYG